MKAYMITNHLDETNWRFVTGQEDAIQAAAESGGAHIGIWDMEDMAMSKHPTSLIRPLLANRILRELGFDRECDDLNKRWYGIIERYETNDELLWIDFRPEGRIDMFSICVDEILKSFEIVLPEILSAKMKCFGGSSLLDIVQFDNVDYVIVCVVSDELLGGIDEFERFVKPRHILAASRLAFESYPDKADLIHGSAIKALIHFKNTHMNGDD